MLLNALQHQKVNGKILKATNEELLLVASYLHQILQKSDNWLETLLGGMSDYMDSYCQKIHLSSQNDKSRLKRDYSTNYNQEGSFNDEFQHIQLKNTLDCSHVIISGYHTN
jgi:hypothetical protein